MRKSLHYIDKEKAFVLDAMFNVFNQRNAEKDSDNVEKYQQSLVVLINHLIVPNKADASKDVVPTFVERHHDQLQFEQDQSDLDVQQRAISLLLDDSSFRDEFDYNYSHDEYFFISEFASPKSGNESISKIENFAINKIHSNMKLSAHKSDMFLGFRYATRLSQAFYTALYTNNTRALIRIFRAIMLYVVKCTELKEDKLDA